MANPILGWLLFAGLFFGSKKVPFEIPEVFFGMRIAYAVSTIIVLLIYTYTKGSVDNCQDKSTITYTEPAKDGKDTNVTITVKEYDLKQWKVLIKGFCMSLLIFTVMHVILKMPGPLLINMVLPLKNAMESDLIQSHVLNKNIERPFPPPKTLVTAVKEIFGKTSETKKGTAPKQE